MKIEKLVFALMLFVSMPSIAQTFGTEIITEKGIRYITTSVEYQIEGTYTYKGKEPIAILNRDGTGIYQLHDQPQRSIIWGIECNKEGQLKFTKGFDNVKYALYYKFNGSVDGETEENWNKVDFTIHLNSLKMYINGERVKNFTP